MSRQHHLIFMLVEVGLTTCIFSSTHSSPHYKVVNRCFVENLENTERHRPGVITTVNILCMPFNFVFFFFCACGVFTYWFIYLGLFSTPLSIISIFLCASLEANKMQFSGAKRKKQQRLTGDQRNTCYPHSLQFYLQPPSENISLMEFENLAIDRVKCEWYLN